MELFRLNKQLSALCLILSCLYVYSCDLYFVFLFWSMRFQLTSVSSWDRKSWAKLRNFSSTPKHPIVEGRLGSNVHPSFITTFVSGQWLHSCKNYCDCSQWWRAHWSCIHYWDCAILDKKPKENRSIGFVAELPVENSWWNWGRIGFLEPSGGGDGLCWVVSRCCLPRDCVQLSPGPASLSCASGVSLVIPEMVFLYSCDHIPSGYGHTWLIIYQSY